MMKHLVLALALTVAGTQAEAVIGKRMKTAPVAEEQAPAEEAPIGAKLVVDGNAKAQEAAMNIAPEVQAAAAPAGVEAVAPVAAEAAVETPKADVSKLPESQIPVLTNTKDVKKAGSGGMARLMITLGVLAVALGAAAFGLKRWQKREGTKQKNTRIKVLTQHALGPKKSLAIVQVAGESILIGITDQNISMLRTLSLIDDEIPEETPRNFDRALEDYEEADEMARGGRGRQSAAIANEEEDFTISGLNEIRDSVSGRIRKMKNL